VVLLRERAALPATPELPPPEQAPAKEEAIVLRLATDAGGEAMAPPRLARLPSSRPSSRGSARALLACQRRRAARTASSVPLPNKVSL
jgi:hypothetical protein